MLNGRTWGMQSMLGNLLFCTADGNRGLPISCRTIAEQSTRCFQDFLVQMKIYHPNYTTQYLAATSIKSEFHECQCQNQYLNCQWQKLHCSSLLIHPQKWGFMIALIVISNLKNCGHIQTCITTGRKSSNPKLVECTNNKWKPHTTCPYFCCPEMVWYRLR